MQQISELLKGLQKTVGANAPAILTGIGVTGTISTAILAGQAHAKATVRLMEAEGPEVERLPFPLRERVERTWTLYIPAVGTGVMTIACILGANHISSKRSTALITAYSLTEKAFSDYKEKVVEQIGVNKEGKVRESIAQDRVNEDPASSKQVVITGTGEVLCYETITGRYFKSSMETLRKGENNINYTILHEMYASLNDYNREIGLANTSVGEDLGWTSDKPLEVVYLAVLAEDQQTPCISISYKELPFPKYNRFG